MTTTCKSSISKILVFEGKSSKLRARVVLGIVGRVVMGTILGVGDAGQVVIIIESMQQKYYLLE